MQERAAIQHFIVTAVVQQQMHEEENEHEYAPPADDAAAEPTAEATDNSPQPPVDEVPEQGEYTLQAVFEYYDTNGDGYIDEVRRDHHMDSPPPRIACGVLLTTANGICPVSQAELQVLADELSHDAIREPVPELLRRFDVGGVGQIPLGADFGALWHYLGGKCAIAS
eukprot:SAG11_NODE_4227_length_2001_cov_1.447424_3_plen_168_part_00